MVRHFCDCCGLEIDKLITPMEILRIRLNPTKKPVVDSDNLLLCYSCQKAVAEVCTKILNDIRNKS